MFGLISVIFGFVKGCKTSQDVSGYFFFGSLAGILEFVFYTMLVLKVMGYN